MRIRECSGPAEYPLLVAIWRSAVEATHHFLAEADRADIEGRLADAYFPNRLRLGGHHGRWLSDHFQ